MRASPESQRGNYTPNTQALRTKWACRSRSWVPRGPYKLHGRALAGQGSGALSTYPFFLRNQDWTGHILLCPHASCKLEVRHSPEPTAGRMMGQGLLQTEVLRKGLECSACARRQYPSTCNGSWGARRFHKDLRDSTRIGRESLGFPMI